MGRDIDLLAFRHFVLDIRLTEKFMFGLFKTKEKTWNSMNDFLKTVLSQLNGRNINEFRHGLILPQKYSSLLPFLKAEPSKWIMPNLRPEVEFLSE